MSAAADIVLFASFLCIAASIYGEFFGNRKTMSAAADIASFLLT